MLSQANGRRQNSHVAAESLLHPAPDDPNGTMKRDATGLAAI